MSSIRMPSILVPLLAAAAIGCTGGPPPPATSPVAAEDPQALWVVIGYESPTPILGKSLEGVASLIHRKPVGTLAELRATGTLAPAASPDGTRRWSVDGGSYLLVRAEAASDRDVLCAAADHRRFALRASGCVDGESVVASAAP